MFDSRTTQFAKRVRDVTGGEGVDVVLNSLLVKPSTPALAVLTVRLAIHRTEQTGYLSEPIGGTRCVSRQRLLSRGRSRSGMARERPAFVGQVLQKVMTGWGEVFNRPAALPDFPGNSRRRGLQRNGRRPSHRQARAIDVTETQDLMLRPQSSPDWSVGHVPHHWWSGSARAHRCRMVWWIEALDLCARRSPRSRCCNRSGRRRFGNPVALNLIRAG